MNKVKIKACLIAINPLTVFAINAQNVFPPSGTTKVGDLTFSRVIQLMVKVAFILVVISY